MAKRIEAELVSLLAPNADAFYEALAAWLTRATARTVRMRRGTAATREAPTTP